MRPPFRVSIATLYPLPTSPSTLAPGTEHPSRINSVVLEARIPSLSSFLPTLNPDVLRSITNAVMPLYPCFGSTLANTRKMSASAPLVIHSLRPVRTQSPSCFVARVVSPNASDPEPGSDRGYAPPVRARGRGGHGRWGES